MVYTVRPHLSVSSGFADKVHASGNWISEGAVLHAFIMCVYIYWDMHLLKCKGSYASSCWSLQLSVI